MRDDGIVSVRFAEELRRRHDEDIVEWIEQEDQKHRGQKLDNVRLVKMAENLIPIIDQLPEQPDYWSKLKQRYN